MDNQKHGAMDIAEEVTEKPIHLIPNLKAAIAEMSARQICKLALLGLALIIWYPIYSRLAPFSNWVTYDLFPIAQGAPGRRRLFFFLDIPKVFLLLILVISGCRRAALFFYPRADQDHFGG